MLLHIDAYRKYEPLLHMLNLLTVLSVRLLARVPTVLAVPVLELELVFERTLKVLAHHSSFTTHAQAHLPKLENEPSCVIMKQNKGTS